MGLDSLLWKLKQNISKLMPLMLIGLVLYGGATLHRRGILRQGILPTVSYIGRHIPIVGSLVPKLYWTPAHHHRSFAFHHHRHHRRHHHGHRRHHHRRHHR